MQIMIFRGLDRSPFDNQEFSAYMLNISQIKLSLLIIGMVKTAYEHC